MIREKFPGHAILSEECGRGAGPKSDYLWVIDPLDGTVNFSRRIPLWGTSVALVHQGREIVGVIFDPVHDELFHAEEGKGAFLNGKRIRVSDKSPLSAAMIAFGFSSNEEWLRRGLAAAAQLPLAASKVRGLGSAVLHLAYVACGRMDGFFEFGINQWDIAAGRRPHPRSRRQSRHAHAPRRRHRPRLQQRADPGGVLEAGWVVRASSRIAARSCALQAQRVTCAASDASSNPGRTKARALGKVFSTLPSQAVEVDEDVENLVALHPETAIESPTRLRSNGQFRSAPPWPSRPSPSDSP